jgi:RNA recognition motif-containing protein
MKIFVGNLSKSITEDDLKKAFAAYGDVSSVTILVDKFTGEPRGFGFVEMPGKAHAQAAITGLNYQEVKGQTIKVNEARPNPQGGRGGSNRGGRRW